MRALLQRVERSIVDHQLFQPGQAVLIAVSGGLDSMVLLALLARLRGRSLHWRVKAKFISIGNTVGAGCLMEAADELDAILGQPIERERP